MFCNALVILHSQIKNRYKKKRRRHSPLSATRLYTSPQIGFFFLLTAFVMLSTSILFIIYLFWQTRSLFREFYHAHTHLERLSVNRTERCTDRTVWHKQTDEESSALGLHNLNKLNCLTLKERQQRGGEREEECQGESLSNSYIC